MQKLLKPIFRAMIPDQIGSESIELQRQYHILISVLLIGSFFLIMLGIVTTIQQEFLLSIFDFSIAFIFIGLGFYLKSTGKIKEIGTIFVSFLAIYFYYLFNYQGLEHSTWVWYYTFPLWSICILGARSGLAISLFLLVVTLLTHAFLADATHQIHLSTNLLIRFSLSYCCVTFITFLIESTRASVGEKLITANKELEKTISELRDAKGIIHQLSTHDSLTGLHNERHFSDILSLSLSHANRYDGEIAITLIELDFHNNYGSRYGKEMLESTIRQVAETIKPIVKEESESFCKLDGERFALIHNNAAADVVERIGTEITKAVANRKIEHDRSPFKIVTVSTGSIVIPNNQTAIEPAQALAFAERTLGRCIDKGRNCTTTSLYTGQAS